MNTEPTASQTRYEDAHAKMVQEQFRHEPDYLIEAVATHYASLATLALQLKQLIHSKRHHGGNNEQIEWAINHTREQIVQAHVGTFGILPAWEIMRLNNLKTTTPDPSP